MSDQPLSCGHCGQQHDVSARYCSACGVGLPHAANDLGTHKRDRKQVTVLFADIQDSMRHIFQDRDAEEADRLLEAIRAPMKAAVRALGGRVISEPGDGIMAVFGAPRALEDHAWRACAAAIQIRDATPALNEQLRKMGLASDVKLRIGINSGDVVVRTSEAGEGDAAIGQTTNIAARLEKLATPGTIALAAATYRLAGELVRVRTCGLQRVKGVDQPIEVFELLGLWPARSRWQ